LPTLQVVALLFLLGSINSTLAQPSVDAAAVLRSIGEMAQAPPAVLAYMRKLLATHKGSTR
jgi:hypothetical protein